MVALIHMLGGSVGSPRITEIYLQLTKCLELILRNCSFYVNFIRARADKKAIFVTQNRVLAFNAERSREVVHGRSKASSRLPSKFCFSCHKLLCSGGVSAQHGADKIRSCFHRLLSLLGP